MAIGTTSNICLSETEELDSKYTRLHITPLNLTLLPSILPPSVLPAARNISYHSLQTFPEKNFGFVDLPSMEAQKIKKKLNGSILKGTKIQIEDARPTKQKAEDEDVALPVSKASADRREIPQKKRKRDTDTLLGIELRDRRVKRGWTDPVTAKKLDRRSKGRKDVVKSKYTTGPELLFRTSLPANVPASTLDINIEQRKKRKLAKEVVVHEFSKTTKHATFLRSSTISSTAKGVAQYLDGKGWVDATGNVVEATAKKPKKANSHIIQKLEDSSESSVSSDVEEELEDEDITEETEKEPITIARQPSVEELSTSSSGTSSDENETEADTSPYHLSREDESSELDDETDNSRPIPSPKTPIALKIDIPKTGSTPIPVVAVHPLEALFKRRRPDLEAPKIPDAVPSFSFFDGDAEDDDEKDAMGSIPMTPFTKQDFALRGLRSAAPTPDTAFPDKTYTVWPTDNVSKEDDADLDGEATPTQNKAKETTSQEDPVAAPVSDFQKWFYEHRGENNRAWKRRRKVVAKEKKHRENKKRNQRTV